MTKIIIDGKELDVPAEYTLLQACEAAGAEIPRFWFHGCRSPAIAGCALLK
jgi:NADH-quinone oxidoreductase subunit G